VINPAKEATQPIPASLGTIPLRDPALPLYIFCPKVSSSNIMGIPTMKRAQRYARIKVTPPCLNVRNGNLQIFPKPIEHPTVARIKVGLPHHLILSVLISSLGPCFLATAAPASATAGVIPSVI
jgi:hypothetical protein